MRDTNIGFTAAPTARTTDAADHRHGEWRRDVLEALFEPHGAFSKRLARPKSAIHFARASTQRHPRDEEFVPDSPLEGDGFELSVPRRKSRGAPPQLLHLIREERRAWTLAKAVPVGSSRYGTRHGVSRGTQRGTLARKPSYCAPNVCLSVGSSYTKTEDVEKEPEQRGIPEEAPIAE